MRRLIAFLMLLATPAYGQFLDGLPAAGVGRTPPLTAASIVPICVGNTSATVPGRCTNARTTVGALSAGSSAPLQLFTWTTPTRPASPVAGTFGYNSTLNATEFWNGSAWTTGATAATWNGGLVTNYAQFDGSGTGLSVTNNATVGGTFGVTGASTLTGGGQLGGNWNGALNLTDTGTALAVTNNATIGGTLTVGGTVTLTGAVTSLAVTNNSTVGGTFGVTGASTLASLAVTNNATVGGTFGATGNTTVGGTLGVTGDTTLAGAGTGLVVTNNATIGGTLAVTGNMTAPSLDATAATLALGTTSATTVNIGNSGSTTTVGGELQSTGSTSPSSAAITPFFLSNIGTLGGTVVGLSDINRMVISNDAADCTAAANGECTQLSLYHNVGTATVNGGRSNIWSQLNVGTLTHTDLEMEGIHSAIFSSAPNASAFLQPLTSSVDVSGAATETGGIGNEFDYSLRAGTAGYKVGLIIGLSTSDAIAGTSTDAGINLMSSNAAGVSPGMGYGLQVGQVNQGFPISTTGTILGAVLQTSFKATGRTVHFVAPQAFAGADFSTVDFTQASGFAFRSPGFQVDGNGNTRIANALISTNATGVGIDVDRQIVTAVSVAAGGGGGGSGTNDYYAGDILFTASGGSYRVSTVEAGAVTAVAILNPGTSASPPANPVATTGGSGLGATLNLTWTARQALSLGTIAATAINIGNAGSTTTIAGAIHAGASIGVSCSGAPTSGFTTVNGIVTAC